MRRKSKTNDKKIIRGHLDRNYGDFRVLVLLTMRKKFLMDILNSLVAKDI
jgi:hypothetical protein